MSDSVTERALPTLNVATLGHVHHGKTTLTAAITQLLARRPGSTTRPLRILDITKGAGLRSTLPAELSALTLEEREQLSVHASQLWYSTPQRHYLHLDLPGQRRYARLVARMCVAVDAAVLVVEAPSSVEPQTREQVILARCAGVSQFLVFMNKCDQVEDEAWLDMVESDIREMLMECGVAADEVPIIRGAALPSLQGDPLWMDTVEDLIDRLDQLTLPTFDPEPAGILSILANHPRLATPRTQVIGGRVMQGRFAKGQRVTLVGRGAHSVATIQRLEVEKREVASVRAGQVVGVCLSDLAPVGRSGHIDLTVLPGQVMAKGDAAPATRRFTCTIKLLPTAQGGRHTPILDGHMMLVILGAAAVPATIAGASTLGGLKPGSETPGITLQLSQPAMVLPGMRFALRDGCDGLAWLRKGEPLWGGTAGMGVVEQVEPGSWR